VAIDLGQYPQLWRPVMAAAADGGAADVCRIRDLRDVNLMMHTNAMAALRAIALRCRVGERD